MVRRFTLAGLSALVISLAVVCGVAHSAGGLHRQTITPNVGPGDNWFGQAVAVDGTTAVVGAPLAAKEAGVATVYSDTSGSWQQTQQLTPQNPSGVFLGETAAVSGSTLVVGIDGGQDDIYQLEAGNWVFTQSVTGGRVALDGSLMVIGRTISSDQPAADIYTLSGGTWTLAQELTLPRDKSSSWPAVATNGIDVMFGAPAETQNRGIVDTYRQVSGVWTKEQSLHDPVLEADQFGSRVSVAGTTLLVSCNGTAATGDAPGEVFVYSDANAAAKWKLQTQLGLPSTVANPEFGYATATDGTSVLVGAPQQNSTAGSVYLYTRVAGVWTQQREIDSPTTAADAFGSALAVEPQVALVGRPGFQHDLGAVYSYTGAAIK